MKAVLMLEDGRGFNGEALGAQGERCGEVILNTAVVGYQEMMTDPANAGKILVLTYPLIGNYGCAAKFNESKKVWLSGLVIKEKSHIYSNWQARSSFDDFIEEHNLLTLMGIDTRALAVHLRNKGEMLGIISTQVFEPKELLTKIQEFRRQPIKTILPEISVKKPTPLGKSRTCAQVRDKGKRIAVLDLGVTQSLIKQLENLGLSLVLLPYNISAKEILRLKLKGLIISNGPEEDGGLKEVIANVKGLLGKLPILGISTGHQVLAAALGAKVVKMKLGHRGVNYPVYNPKSYKGKITVQNHSWAVDTDSLTRIKGIKITAYNLNDRSVEEMESKKLKFMGMQYYPASPGFKEVNPALKKFSKMLTKE